MDRLRTWVLLTAAAAAAVLAGGWMLIVSPEKDEAAALREQVASQDALNQQASTRLQVLRQKADALPEQEAELAEVTAAIPEQADLPGLIRALTAAATSAGVELVSVTPGTPAALTPAAGAPAGGTAAAPATGDPGTAAPSTPAAPATGAAGGVTAVPVTLSVSGTYYDTEEFVADLEDLTRAFRVTSLALAPAEGTAAASAGTVLTSSIGGLVYARGATAPPAAGTATGTGTAPAPAVTTEQQPPAASS